MPYTIGRTHAEKTADKKKKKKPEQELTPAQRFKVAKMKQKVKDASRSGRIEKNMEIR